MRISIEGFEFSTDNVDSISPLLLGGETYAAEFGPVKTYRFVIAFKDETCFTVQIPIDRIVGQVMIEQHGFWDKPQHAESMKQLCESIGRNRTISIREDVVRLVEETKESRYLRYI